MEDASNIPSIQWPKLAELAIIMSYPTSASGKILKTPTILRILPDFICKRTDFQLVLNFEQTRTVTLFGEHDIMAYIP